MTLRKNSILNAKSFYGLTLIVAFILVTAGQVNAQPMMQQQSSQQAKPSDEELELFVEAVQEVQPLQQESQEKMIKKIQDKDLTVQEYNKIMQASQNPEGGSDVSPEKEQAFQQASQEVQTIQQQYQQKIQQKIQETGLGMNKYQQIMTAYQQDPEVQSKINELMQQ